MSEQALEILKRRADALAKDVEVSTSSVPLVLFTRAGQTYGLAVEEVEASGRLREASPVPGAPPYLIGAVHHRGSVLSLVDLLALWGVEQAGVVDMLTYLVLTGWRGNAEGERERVQIGLAVERLIGVQEVEDSIFDYDGNDRPGLVQVTSFRGAPVWILSVEALLKDPRL